MKALTSILLAASAAFSHSAVREDWVARYHLAAGGDNRAVTMALDAQGNVIVGGHGTSTNGDTDYVVLKYAPSGTLLWQGKHGTPTNETALGMAVDGAGNVVLTGNGGTVKWVGDGSEIWSADYSGRGIALDRTGDVYVTGFDATSFSTVKLHGHAGTNLWLHFDKVLALDRGKDVSQVICVDAETNVFVAGEVTCYWEPRTAYGNRRIISYSGDGAVRWKTPVPMNECTYSSIRMVGIASDSEGNSITVAEALPGSVQAVKYDRTGLFKWTSETTYALGGLKASCFDNDGFAYVTGVAIDFSQMAIQIRTTKISPSGTNVWSVGYGQGAATKIANALARDVIGNVYVTGQLEGNGGANDYATIKYSPSGQELWVQRYDGPAHGDDVATAIAVAPDGSVYVTGWSTTSSNLVEITTIKYVQTAGLTVQSNREVNLQFPAPPGSNNRVQATTNFLQWLDLGFSVADTNGLLHFLDTNAPNHPFRFYRTVRP